MSEGKKNLRAAKEVNDWKNLFRSFFARYFILGLALLVIAYIIRLEICPLLKSWPKIDYMCNILHLLCNAMGIALILASVFSFSIESASFLDYMKRILVRIVVSKDFLRNLTSKNKKEALELILKPSEDQLKLYSNIEEYFNEYIDQSMHLFETNFKSKGVMNLFATYSEDDPTVRIEHTLSYTLYRTETRFQPLELGFENEKSEIQGGEITPPNEPHRQLKPDEFKKEQQVEESGFVWTQYKYDLPDDLHIYPYIAVQMRFVEYGHYHWQFFTLKVVGYYDGFTATFRCDRDLIVNGYMIYDLERNYSVNLSDDKKVLQINCNQWIQPGRGFSILVGKDTSSGNETTKLSSEQAQGSEPSP